MKEREEINERSIVYVEHKGFEPEEKVDFANQISFDWENDLWNKGTLIYDLKNNINPNVNEDILKFDSKFESGNLSKVFHFGGNTYHCILEYDVDGSCQWFYFKFYKTYSNRKYDFYISGFPKENMVFSSGYKIFVYSEKRAELENISWYRSGYNYSFAQTYKCDSEVKRSTFHFEIEFPYDEDVCYFCLSIPYTYTDLLRNIEVWKSLAPNVFKSDTLCKTICGRDVPILKITSESSLFTEDEKKYILITGRIHPGETTGSEVLHGLIDFLLSDNEYSKYTLLNTIVVIIPMISIDEVVNGISRTSMFGDDLSRCWENPSFERHPVLKHIKLLVEKMLKEREILLYIDFHGHIALNNTFIYGCPNNDDTKLKNSEKIFPRILSFICPKFSWENCQFSYPKLRTGTGRTVLRKTFNIINSFTMETSFCGIRTGIDTGFLFNIKLWREIGHDTCKAIFHFMLGAKSQIFSYVKNEINTFSVTQSSSKISPLKDGKELLKTINKQGRAKKDNVNLSSLKSDKKGYPIKLKQPTSFLVFTPDQISETKSDIISKWNHLSVE